jgi:hypothetical protein
MKGAWEYQAVGWSWLRRRACAHIAAYIMREHGTPAVCGLCRSTHLGAGLRTCLAAVTGNAERAAGRRVVQQVILQP